ncbi:MAG: lytic transglycosylase domain-containing protein [Actinomycetota bacterium]|nr:lytic transglycosylase domain-containing protein [Actinomycetota bacterium]
MVVTAALTGTMTTALTAAPAAAETSREAAAKAKVLAARMRVLQGKTDLALQRYQAALGKVSADVNAATIAAGQQRDGEQAADTAQGTVNRRVRTLYISGGRPGLYASLVTSHSLTDLTSRVGAMQRLVSTGQASANGQATAAMSARIAAAAARTQALASISTAKDVSVAADGLQALLDQQKALLANANANVRRQRAAEAAAAALAAAQAAAGRITAGGIQRIGPLPGSALYFQLYHSAAPTCPGLSWSLLAAIGQVESGHGRNTGSSSAGAQGPMQFMPATFAAYAVDGDHDGHTDILSPADSIYTAAHYLCANHAGMGPAGVRNALFRYNHAQWYVDMVIALAARYAGGG